MATRVPKTRCSQRWTEARYRSFITSMLRRGSMRWMPKADTKRNARHPEKLLNERGRLVFHSQCAMCKDIVPETTTAVDHINPIVDPDVGFTTWDQFIESLFCEEEGLQVLCKPCHDTKTAEEKAKAVQRRKNEKAIISK